MFTLPVYAIDADMHSIQNGEETIIHIENSRFTSFAKGHGSDGDSITLEGDARVSIEQGGKTSVIRADTIKLERENNILYANGNITITQSNNEATGDGSTQITAKSLLLNTHTMEGIFDGGKTVKLAGQNTATQSGAASTENAQSSLIVSSSIFGKGKSGTIAFKHGSLTFCDDDDPHWRIDASRIWMLPGGEFAFFNALLYAGEVPVLYLPGFYYPKDELIFNPVMGYDKKLGYFVQTTTYLYGRKSLSAYDTAPLGEDTESAFNLTRPTVLKEQRREGIILHNLEKDYTGQTQNYIKLMTDWYANMGWGVGLDSAFSGMDGPLSDIKAGMRLGFTDTVFNNAAGRWTPYSPLGERYKDEGNFIGVKMPFRFETNFEMSLVRPFSMNIKMPIYSDPYFHDDFAGRHETMDWINYLLSSAKSSNTEDSEDDNTDKERTGVSAFEWQLDTSYTLSPPEAITPYLNSASISTKSGISFTTAVNNTLLEETQEADKEDVMLRSPNQKFYFPSIVNPIGVNAAFSGTVFEYKDDAIAPSKKRKGTAQDDGAKALLEGLKQNMQKPNEIKSDKEKAEEQKEEGEVIKEGKEEAFDFKASLPEMDTKEEERVEVPGFNYALSYNFDPEYSSQIAYSSTGLDGPDDFDWSKKKSYMYTLHLPVSLTNNLSVGGEAARLTNTITYDPFWQDHPYLSTDTEHGGYTEEGKDSVKVADYTATKQTLKSGNTLQIKPFYYIPHFKDTGIKYDQDVKIFTTNFIGDADNPKWEMLTTDWNDEDFVPTHQLQAIFAATEGFNDCIGQTLTLTASLPPRPDEYTADLKLFVPHVTYTISTGVRQMSAEDDTWVKQDLKQDLSVSLFDKKPLRFSASFNYNMEENYKDSLKLSLDWQGLQAAYQMAYTRGFDFVDGEGWEERDKEEFLPYSFSLAYAPDPWTIHRWKNRIALKLGINTSIVSDLLKPTDSYFIFEPQVAFNIHDAFTITFSSTTKNSVIYRYVQKMFGTAGRIPGEDNLFKDLADSFRFDNEDLRKSSGFKLKSINIAIAHSLHDWSLNALYKMTPRLITDGKRKHYDFDPYATISVVWRPLGAMKTEIRDDYGNWQLNP